MFIRRSVYQTYGHYSNISGSLQIHQDVLLQKHDNYPKTRKYSEHKIFSYKTFAALFVYQSPLQSFQIFNGINDIKSVYIKLRKEKSRK